ncbi:MAG TPA: glycine cleavage system protein GcvH [Gammaproteobacteria bacterium]|jgi:glycine cleavage system H protein
MSTSIPEELRYNKSHEWVRDDGDGLFTVGITDHAQKALGDLVYVEAAEVGNVVSADDACCVVESVKAASDVYSPLDGEIVEANEALEDSPELVNNDPYGDGWLFRIKPTTPADFDALLDADAYAGLLSEEE